jgi:hypothetical protein
LPKAVVKRNRSSTNPAHIDKILNKNNEKIECDKQQIFHKTRKCKKEKISHKTRKNSTLKSKAKKCPNCKKDKKWEKMVNKKLKKIINREFGKALGPSKINKKK